MLIKGRRSPPTGLRVRPQDTHSAPLQPPHSSQSWTECRWSRPRRLLDARLTAQTCKTDKYCTSWKGTSGETSTSFTQRSLLTRLGGFSGSCATADKWPRVTSLEVSFGWVRRLQVWTLKEIGWCEVRKKGSHQTSEACSGSLGEASGSRLHSSQMVFHV